MTREAGPPPGKEAPATRDVHALAVLLLAGALGVGTALPLLGPVRVGWPPPRVPERAAHAGVPARAPLAGISVTRSPSSLAGPLSLNTADAETLEALPGIGPTLAARILAYRQVHGPFQAVEDLLLVPGIGPHRWARIRPLVRVAEEP